MYHYPKLCKMTEAAVEKAISFLGGMRDTKGLWYDFTLEGGSDEWVTAVVGSVLADSVDPKAIGWCRQAWEQIGSRNLFTGHGGWGYNQKIPEDADSTAWGIKFAMKSGLAKTGRITLAVNALKNYITKEGGLTTYIHDAEIRNYIRVPGIDLSGWKMTHTCNTAAGAVLPQTNGLLCSYLIKKQLPAGNWDAYWLTDTVYPTVFAMEALALNDPESHRESIGRARRWILNKAGTRHYLGNRFLPEGSPFATAMALKGLALVTGEGQYPETEFSMLSWLLENQSENGSWKSSFFLLKIPPDHTGSFTDESPDEFPDRWASRVYPDIRSVMTTAFVLGSLLTIQKTIFNRS